MSHTIGMEWVLDCFASFILLDFKHEQARLGRSTGTGLSFRSRTARQQHRRVVATGFFLGPQRPDATACQRLSVLPKPPK
jgi:hypothetical protein